MRYFYAKNDKQFCTCIRLLYDAEVKFNIDPAINNKGKMDYRIYVDVDEARYEMLLKRYKVMIS